MSVVIGLFMATEWFTEWQCETRRASVKRRNKKTKVLTI